MALIPRQAFNDHSMRRIPGRKMKIAPWNVRNLFATRMLDNVVMEMNRLEINVLDISEIQWSDSEKCSVNRTIYYSNSDCPSPRQNACVIVSSVTNKFVTNFTPMSKRVMLLRLQSEKIPINIFMFTVGTEKW